VFVELSQRFPVHGFAAMPQDRTLSKMPSLQGLLHNAASRASRGAATSRRPGGRLPWDDAARLLIVLSIAGWVGIFALWQWAF
jgi:hypothetical protein